MLTIYGLHVLFSSLSLSPKAFPHPASISGHPPQQPLLVNPPSELKEERAEITGGHISSGSGDLVKMKKRYYKAEKACVLLIAFLCTLHFISIGLTRSFTPTPLHQDTTRFPRAKQSTLVTWPLILRSRRSTPMVCDRSGDISDWCYLNRPTALNSKTATFSALHLHSASPHAPQPSSERIRPYPRKWEPATMSGIREFTLTTQPLRRHCDVYHDSPALAFSTAAYTGNLFHDFNDGLIPLFITLHTLFPPGRDVTLVISRFTNWWYSKYETILPEFSRLPVINLDNQTVTHCFPSVVVGLISHGPMTIDPTRMRPTPKTMLDFRTLLENGYSKHFVPVKPVPLKPGQPRLVLVGRKGGVGRVLINQDEIVQVAERTGFDVVIFEPNKFTYLVEAYALINGSHALMGVHGAALTHAMFLRPGAVLMQVVPLGNDWLAETYFESMADRELGIGLEYMEYKIRAEESSLAEKYGMESELVRNPKEVASRNWTALDTVYLKGQDVKIDMKRFERYLRRAYFKAKRFMDQYG